MAFDDNMGLEHLHRPLLPEDHRHRPMAPSSSLGPDVPMALSGSTGHLDQHVSPQKHAPQISTWSPVAAQSKHLLGGNLGHRP